MHKKDYKKDVIFLLDIGFNSGCLTVVSNNAQSNHESIMQNIAPMAIQEWNKFDKWVSSQCSWLDNTDEFNDYYKLNKTEKKLFDNKSDMPNSFVEKYYIVQLQKNPGHFLRQLSDVLYHKKNPNTNTFLIKSLTEHKLYAVRCNICNRTYFMDEFSINCVKWNSCSGAECLSHTVSDKVCDYTNLCNVNNNSNVLQFLNSQLSSIENISNPLSYYGGYSDLNISYISDVHLRHHLKGNISMKSLIHSTVKRLYATMDKKGIILFVGDISSDINVTIEFYTRFVKYNDFLLYKSKKKYLCDIQYDEKHIDANKRKMELKIINLTNYITNLKSYLSPYLNFDSVIKYKNRYYKHESWVTTINAYKTLNSYVIKNISDKCDFYLDLIAQKLDLLTDFENSYDKYLSIYEDVKQQYIDIESLYNKFIKDLTIKDIYTEHHLLSDERQIIAVLGNHEYNGFNSVNEAIEYYKQFFDSLGIKLLQNDYFKFHVNDKHCVIFGGTGFAKYNPKYNADTLECCNNFTRQDEFKETSLFEKEYAKARQLALADNACFICVSHYPPHDCSVCIDNDTIYFYGHNHQNFYHKNENEIIYADNQIGFKNPNIEFKTMTTGLELNPYFILDDGLYKTTIKDYLQFYKHIGESVGDGSLLYQRCQNDKASIYVIKRKGYYGFFILNLNTGASKGISIVNGGKTKKITKSTDLQWLFDNFEVVLSKYLQVLAPLRLAQEQISNELKDLGFSGSIHGCIIDVDFYHHIMLNPVDGTMTYYYSPEFGLIQPISSFDKVILSIQKNDVGLFASNRDYKLLHKQFNDRKQNSTYLLCRINESYLLEKSDSSYDVENVTEQGSNRTERMYGVSRKINPLQRLFSGHVLRDFDLKLVDTQPI